MDEVVHRQQLDRRHPESGQVGDRLIRREPRIGPAQMIGQPGEVLGEPLDVQLIDDRVCPGDAQQLITLPIEMGVDHHRLGHRVGIVGGIDLEVVVGCAVGDIGQDVAGLPLQVAVDRLGVRVDEQLVGVEAMPLVRDVGPAHPVSVELAGSDTRDVAMPLERGLMTQLDLGLRPVLIEQAQHDRLGVLGEQREVRAAPVPGRTEGKRIAWPDVHAGTRRVGRSSFVIGIAGTLPDRGPRVPRHRCRLPGSFA